MDLYKRADGRSPFWHFDTTDAVTGKRVRKSTGETDKKKAAVKAMEEITRLGAKVRETTLGEAVAAYVDRMKADGLKSWKDAEAKASKTLGRMGEARWHIDPATKLSAITPSVVQKLKVERTREGNQPGTIAGELRILRAACKHAEEQGFAPPPIRKWGVPPTKRRLRYLTPDEATLVLRDLEPSTEVGIQREMAQDVHDVYLALLLTGGRWNEVASMTWRQVDPVRRTIVLYGWKGQRERTVPLTEEAAAMFARRAAKPRGPYIFPGKGGEVRSGPCRAIYRAFDRLGLNAPAVVAAFGRATIHSLRHTYASWLRQKGLGLDEIQPLLGHADIKTTQIYAKVVDATTLAKAQAALSGWATEQKEVEA